jgi:hypothetical protein
MRNGEWGMATDGRGKELTDGNDVADRANGPQVERRSNQMLAPARERDDDRARIRHGQEDDPHTRERVESRHAPKVDDSQHDLDSHTQHHRIQRDIQPRVDDLPPPTPRDGAVAGKRPGAATRGRGAADTTEEGEHKERDEETECAARGADGAEEDGGDGLPGHDGEELGEVREDEYERNEEEQAGDGVDDDRGDHRFGDLRRRVAHLLTHTNDHSRATRSVRGLQETDAEGPSVGPAGLGLEVAEDVVCGVAAVFRDGEDADDGCDEAGEGPEDGEGLRS